LKKKEHRRVWESFEKVYKCVNDISFMIGKKEIHPFILPGMMLYGGYMTDALRVRSYIPNRDSHLHAEVRVYQTHAKSQSRPETPEVLIAACSVPLYEKPRWSDGGQY